MKLTGLIGGTFNPIHNGHLFAAHEAMHLASLSKILFIPNNIPPHKSMGEFFVSPQHRLKMLEIALSLNPYFGISEIELHKNGPSYTFETVSALKTQEKEKYVFIAGLDSFVNYEWYKFEELLALLEGFVVLGRPGCSQEDFENKKAKCRGGEKIVLYPFPQLEISSTDIRNRLASGRPVRYLLPDEVLDYIKKNKIYTKG